MYMIRSDSPRILINSYACCPDLGSEPGMGWKWIVSLAEYCECFVISEGEFRPQVNQWLAQPENDTIASNLHFYWLPIGGQDISKCERIRQMCRNQGDWRFYYYYRKWQKRAADYACEIIESQHLSGKSIQILHQLNMIGFREPGYLWQVSKEKNIPFVWGPIDAKPGFPMAYADSAPIRVKAFLWLKNIITRLQLRYMLRVSKAANQASVILSANSDSQQSILRYWNKQSILLNETGCTIDETTQGNPTIIEDTAKKSFEILWCGKMDFRKQLDLAIRSVAQSEISNAILHVVGDGDNTRYKQLAMKLNVHAVWYGRLPHDEVQNMMRRSDVLLFTSVAEGTPHVVTEAMVNNLPIVCHKTCGQGDVVTDEVGVTVPLSNPQQSVIDFAQALTYLWKHPEICLRMKKNCFAHAFVLSWDNKAKEMMEIYKKYCEV